MKTLKQNILPLLILLSIYPVSIQAQDATEPKTFTYEHEGQSITYQVIDEEAKTCMTKPGSFPTAGNPDISGELVLPENPMDGDIEYTLTKLGIYSFCNLPGLSKVILPNTITTIEASAFDGCLLLTSISIPTSVTDIGNFAFSLCGFTSLTLPESVTSIGDAAFSECSSLTSIEIPESVTSIGDEAFSKCSSLTSIEIPESVTSIGKDAFSDCLKLSTVTYNAIKAEIYVDPNIPKSPFGTYLDTSNGITIGPSNVTRVVIGDKVETIPDYAFSYCDKLTEITIPQSVSTIDVNAFYASSNLKTVVFNATVCQINGQITPFINATTLTIGDKVEVIPDFAFRRSNLTSVDMISATSLTSIGTEAFSGCSDLQSISIPTSVTSIGEAAFSGCTNLGGVINLGSITRVNKNLFYESCSSPNIDKLEIVIPESVTSIGDGAFQFCFGLTKIDIPSAVTSIGDGAFKSCTNLTKIDIPSAVTSIGNEAFSFCSKMRNINLGNSVKDIGNSAFYACRSVETIKIPSSVKSIGSSAFEECTQLESIYSINTTPPTISNGSFFLCQALKSVIVPNSALGQYKDKWASVGEDKIIASVVLSLSPESMTLSKGETQNISQTSTPAPGINIESQAWSSSNESIATVDTDGKVTAIGCGEAKISFTETDNLGIETTAICTVTVEAPVEGITLDKTTLSLTEGETVTLTATIAPADATNKALTWTSDNETVATVTADGKVTAKAVGNAKITVSSVENPAISASCALTVNAKKIPVEGITLDKTTLSLTEGETVTLTATIAPADAINKALTWASDNEAVATVTADGKVTAKAAGNAKITVSSVENPAISASCALTVNAKEIPVEGITLNKTTLSLTEGETATLTATIAPADATNKALTWASDNEAVATVTSDGKVTAKAAGNAKITVSSVENPAILASCALTVNAKKIPVEGITLDKTTLSLTEGETVTLTATIAPADATNKALTWASDNEAVATVTADGKVTAKAAGNAKITVSSVENPAISASCALTVNAKEIPVASIALDKTELTLTEGESATLVATVLPDNATNKHLSWKSTDESIATVDDNGKVTVIKAGTCKITVSTTDGSNLSATCSIIGITGVEAIFADPDILVDVYSVNGMLIKHDCTRDDLNKLNRQSTSSALATLHTASTSTEASDLPL